MASDAFQGGLAIVLGESLRGMSLDALFCGAWNGQVGGLSQGALGLLDPTLMPATWAALIVQ